MPQRSTIDCSLPLITRPSSHPKQCRDGALRFDFDRHKYATRTANACRHGRPDEEVGLALPRGEPLDLSQCPARQGVCATVAVKKRSGRNTMLKLIAVAGFALLVATSAEAMTPAPM